MQKKFKLDELLKQLKTKYPTAIVSTEIKENSFAVQLYNKDPSYNEALDRVVDITLTSYDIKGPYGMRD
jgi:hypothetical protein